MLPIRLSCWESPRWPHPSPGTEAHRPGGGPRSQKTGRDHCHGCERSGLTGLKSECILVGPADPAWCPLASQKRRTHQPKELASPSRCTGVRRLPFSSHLLSSHLCVLLQCAFGRLMTLSGPNFPSLLEGVGMAYSFRSSNEIFVKGIGAC